MHSWKIVFFIAAAVYIICGTFYNFFATGVRQPWDNPENDDALARRKAEKQAIAKSKKDVVETRH